MNESKINWKEFWVGFFQSWIAWSVYWQRSEMNSHLGNIESMQMQDRWDRMRKGNWDRTWTGKP